MNDIATLGLMLFSVGVILFFGTKVIYKKNKKQIDMTEKKDKLTDKEFLMLVNHGTDVIKFVGAALVAVGALMVVFAA